jgi:uncharacterized protein (TIGR04562 family)
LDSVLGGVSIIDLRQLHISDLDQAYEFARIYGYDLAVESDLKLAWSYHRKAVTFLRDFLLEDNESIPESLTDPKQLKDPAFLLVYASTQEHHSNSIQRWACTILRVIHVYVHLDNDLFHHYRKQIQEQILLPLERRIVDDVGASGPVLGLATEREQISLKRFDVKPMKMTSSAVIKLLAKPATVTQTLFDKLGVRFVTNNVFDAFRVVRYLINEHLISVAHIMPDQSNNTLYPTNLFMECMADLIDSEVALSDEAICQKLDNLLKKNSDSADFREKYNPYSGKNFRNMKFICRHLVSIKASENGLGKKDFRFFYPYEIQIIDNASYLASLAGPASHEHYKERQRRAARARVLWQDTHEPS